jgi:hypothetical protein
MTQCLCGVAITPPRSGEAVLACCCGTVLDLADMCRPHRLPSRDRSGIAIDPIQCRRCAAGLRVRSEAQMYSNAPMIRDCRCGLPLAPPPNEPHWLPTRDPEPGPHVQAVALCGQDPEILRSERAPGGWRTRGAANSYADCTPPRSWEHVGFCWNRRDHPVRDVTGLMAEA